ncbi:hypothetical protein SK128_028224 [Halocaridina rubra]|uniref:Uncharacterized protein n=1 Tax=Halocaridina rubra TaxID=373956 RepID=A0AAN9AE78_HALRR
MTLITKALRWHKDGTTKALYCSVYEEVVRGLHKHNIYRSITEITGVSNLYLKHNSLFREEIWLSRSILGFTDIRDDESSLKHPGN